MFIYICLTRTIQIHQLSLCKPDSFAFKTNINRNLFVRSLKNYDLTFIVCWHCCTSEYFIKRRGRSSPTLPSQVAPRIAPASRADSLRFVVLSATPSADSSAALRCLRSKLDYNACFLNPTLTQNLLDYTMHRQSWILIKPFVATGFYWITFRHPLLCDFFSPCNSCFYIIQSNL